MRPSRTALSVHLLARQGMTDLEQLSSDGRRDSDRKAEQSMRSATVGRPAGGRCSHRIASHRKYERRRSQTAAQPEDSLASRRTRQPSAGKRSKGREGRRAAAAAAGQEGRLGRQMPPTWTRGPSANGRSEDVFPTSACLPPETEAQQPAACLYVRLAAPRLASPRLCRSATAYWTGEIFRGVSSSTWRGRFLRVVPLAVSATLAQWGILVGRRSSHPGATTDQGVPRPSSYSTVHLPVSPADPVPPLPPPQLKVTLAWW
ncbi:uncharacterized protein PSFLO_01657 [Pseudozyma flocculosa]|uniref:Uncharacterized protein n=1 Tax=Pseudozyma flocculosa TaxID=84751 RepID=A0A5C3EX63_9BASI|nr:uncharacterized protein PSFLO_01657 [Pseudozyma flocculosa]